MHGINFGMRAPSTSQVQSVQTHQQGDQLKALEVMKDMATGKVSVKDGLKQLQDLVQDQAKAQATLAPGAPAAAPASAPAAAPTAAPDSAPASVSTSSSSSSAGFSTKDTFEPGSTAKPAVDILSLAGGGTKPHAHSGAPKGDFLDQGGGGSKPGVGSGSNRTAV